MSTTHSTVALEARVQRIEDRDAIWALIAEFRRNVDARDFAALAAMFGSDGRLESALGPAKVGAVQIERLLEASLERTTEATRTYHHVTNPVIVVDGDHGHSESTWCYFDRTESGLPVPSAAGRYSDDFVRTASGWRFASRRIHMDLPFVPLDGVDEGSPQ